MSEAANSANEETGLIQKFGFRAMFRDMPSTHPDKALNTLGLHLLLDVIVYNSGHPSKFWVLRRCSIDTGPLTSAFREKNIPIFN